jgi:tetratricopeptide (TPR) repeat protein
MDVWPDLPEFSEKIHELIDLGLFDEALKTLDEYGNVFPGEPEILLLFARVYSERNQPDKALEYLHQCRQIDNDNIDCLLGLFYAYSQQNELKKGALYLQRAEKLYPDNDMVMSSLIWYYNELNQFENAIECFERAKRLSTGNPETFRNGGLAYQRLGRLQEAEECYRAALSANPRFDEARDLLADLHIVKNEPEKSVELYRSYLAQSPDNIKCLSRLVFCLCQNGDFQEAVTQGHHTISRYPNSPVGYVDLAYVYLNMNELDKATETIDRALDIAPLDAEALRVRGIIHSEKDQPELAEKTFSDALSLDPDNAEIMRDYYHHLRNTGDCTRMEAMVFSVIKQEYPYCMEDYWFMADYHRETGENIKAFHYLRKAWELMSGETELLPPMIDILLDEGHLSYTTPFLSHYVQRSGWNDVMNEFARHTRMKDVWSQEGLRFLRFYAQRPAEFRTYIFMHYLSHFAKVALIILGLVLVPLSWMLYGVRGLILLGGISAGVIAAWIGVRFLIRKMRQIPPQKTFSPGLREIGP